MFAYDINLCFVSVISCDNFLREPVLVGCINVITLYNTLRRTSTISSLTWDIQRELIIFVIFYRRLVKNYQPKKKDEEDYQ